MKNSFLYIFICFLPLQIFSQATDPGSIDIVRDSFGVPHIFAETDAGVAYGLAYAHAEDDFKTIQLGFLSGKSMLGRYKGKSGATIDYIALLLGCQKTAQEQYGGDISADFKKVLQGYCDGFNAYAKANPSEVLVKKLLPLTPVDMISYSILQLVVSSGADRALTQIYNGTISTLAEFQTGGSNAYAFNSKKTSDGNTYLNINAHQPLNGPVSWYEAHLHSNEGWNITGALFPGSPIILLGCNENLAWAHTVNHPDKLDVYQLEINPANNQQYKFNGEWLQLEEETVRLKVKVLGIPIGAKRKIYKSKYGPTVVTAKGVFAIRTGALYDIRALEQWYRMNKATNYQTFYQALKMEAHPGYNVMYADRFDTIFYLSNGKIPVRDKRYNWRLTVPGNTSQTLWNTYHPIEDLPHYLNPPSGYLFNSNHSPYNATAKQDNLSMEHYDSTMSFETNENNRSVRFMELLSGYEKIDYDVFKRIKFDNQLPTPLAYPTKSDTLFLINASEHPELAGVINILRDWNKKSDLQNTGATVFAVIYYYVVDKLNNGDSTFRVLTKDKVLELFTYANGYLQKHFGKISVPLGEYQKLVRGDKALPLSGLPDVIASMENEPYKNGMVKGRQGESYIQLVQFTKDGPIIESIHSYGSSNKKGEKHYDDQMERFESHQLKTMSLDKTYIYNHAERIYHPK